MSWERGEFIVEADCGSDEMVIKERIVRCRDCKYYQPEMYHNIDCEWFMFNVEPDGFCAWGEKNDD